MTSLEISEESLPGGIACLRMKGVLDGHTSAKLNTAISHVLSNGVTRLVVDLSEVSYIGSAGAGAFIYATSQARQRGGDLVLMKLPHRLREIFELLGLLNTLKAADALDEALALLPPAQ